MHQRVMVNVPHPAWIVTCISHKQQMRTVITQIYGDLHRQCTNTGALEEIEERQAIV